MSLDLFREKGVPLDRQVFDWKDLVQAPYSKLNDDAFTRVRVILMNGIEAEAIRFQHACARMNRELQAPLALIRRVEQHQQTLINCLNPPDQSALETTLAFEQVAIEVTAAVAQREPDPYLAQAQRFGMLEDFDHLYRYSALYDRLEGKDPNNILQNYTDIRPGRPTVVEHRHPSDDVRRSYDRTAAHPLTKLDAYTLMAAEHQTHDYYMTVGPQFADPTARQLYAEIASIKEQHVTHYESLIDATETWLEKWLLHEAMEVHNYFSCVAYESNPRLKATWERFLDYELGHLQAVMALFKEVERRDPAEVLPATLEEPIALSSHRAFVRKVLNEEMDLRAWGTEFVHRSELPPASLTQAYQERINVAGSPSETVAAGYTWQPGTELVNRKDLTAGAQTPRSLQ